MNWTDGAIVLGVRPFGEHSAVLEVLTRSHGRHLGLVRSVASKRSRGMYEIGNLLSLQWRARLDQQLGNYSAELEIARAAQFFDDGLKLNGLTAACAACSATLAEREVHERVFVAFDALLQHMGLERSLKWVESYVRFELVLLEDLGFGLDLSQCAVTGVREGLSFVSPKTGKAVTRLGAGDYVNKLLVLPGFLVGDVNSADVEDLLAGVKLTGHFLEQVMREGHRKDLAPSRQRFEQSLSRM